MKTFVQYKGTTIHHKSQTQNRMTQYSRSQEGHSLTSVIS